MAEVARAEITRARQAEKDEAARQSEKDERATLAAQVAKLAERPPAEPRSKLKRLAGGWG